ncbi:GRAM domain-containing protein 2B isoform X1 [Latimeria chalumnae]|uniref:GRAM domain containing 2B n=1 Tax=Latimeria chalumnae TaxID=7897 RepID=H3AHJ5_LATCH|nr:PREDICTED: GRAM domain-containing protein 3 isoform X2 [Latimeria chalumnae]|eukprot:XP_006009654.1 PREDICTED: GRAM domain-containing protein 3 isoform X2 [Latimeria chalumnae]
MVLMTEQQTQLSTPVEDLKAARITNKKENKAVNFPLEAENGVDEKTKKAGKQLNSQLQSLNIDAEIFDNRKKAPLLRSKTFDPSFPAVNVDFEVKLEKKKSVSGQFSKANAHFHKLFREISEEELLKQSFTCALQREILYQGKLFISENWIGFHSKVFGKDTKIIIPVASVTLIKKTKTAILVPNALIIATETERHVFVSLLSRDTTYKLLKLVCIHIEDKSAGNSPNPSSVESSFRAERPTNLPLDFNVDLSAIDGVVRHRRQDVEETSSTGSQSPESENSQEFPSETQKFLKVAKNEELPVHADIHIRHSLEGRIQKYHEPGNSWLQELIQSVRSFHLLSLNTLLIIYAVLVCILIMSTFYMAHKIVTLEQRLATVGMQPNSQGGNEQLAQRFMGSNLQIHADAFYSELSANLVKLEKIQKNLQRLLEDTE